MIDGKFIGKPVVQLVDYFKKCEWNYIFICIYENQSNKQKSKKVENVPFKK
jgi:hypothetical protein